MLPSVNLPFSIFLPSIFALDALRLLALDALLLALDALRLLALDALNVLLGTLRNYKESLGITRNTKILQ